MQGGTQVIGPESSFTACEQADAILLGAMGLPSVRWPDGKEMTPQIDLRERLDLYNGVRPIRLYHELHSPLKNCRAGDIDLMIVRESTERLFSARRSRQSNDVEVTDLMRITRPGAARICRAALPRLGAGYRRPGHSNPIATILSVALMLDWLGTEETRRGAGMIRRTVGNVLSHPDHRTADLGGKLTTTELAELIIGNLEN